MIMLALRALAATAVVLLTATGAFAQEKCIDFQALSQQKMALGVDQTYTGPIFMKLGEEAFVDPGNSPLVSPPATSAYNKMIVREKDAQFKLDFGADGTLIVQVLAAVYDNPFFTFPFFGHYRATEKIVTGTGRFENASGLLVEAGPFWAGMVGPSPEAHYSGEISGKICGVKPR
jgi:hypothetical protein